jgi:hypothetical protein
VIHLSAVDKDDFGRQALVATHNLHQSELLTDAALIDLLDHSQVSFIHPVSHCAPAHRRGRTKSDFMING